MVLQKLWVSQKFSRISRVPQSRFIGGYVSESQFSFARLSKSQSPEQAHTWSYSNFNFKTLNVSCSHLKHFAIQKAKMSRALKEKH